MHSGVPKLSLIDTNEAKRVTRLPDKAAKPQERRPFTDREIRAILKAATGTEGEYEEWYGMVLCGVYQGFRLGDVADLTWSNIDPELGQFRFDTEKTNRAMNVPIAGPLYRYLMEIAGDDPTGPLFPKAHALRKRDVPTSALSNQFYRLMEKAGVVEKRTNKKKKDGPGRSGKRQSPGLGFHCFRYTATSLLKRAGVSDSIAREIIGHESAAVSRLYTSIDTLPSSPTGSPGKVSGKSGRMDGGTVTSQSARSNTGRWVKSSTGLRPEAKITEQEEGR